ncbi:MAG: hypothetical protein ABL982_20800, partial [Vicinamibacterales bacterium]
MFPFAKHAFAGRNRRGLLPGGRRRAPGTVSRTISTRIARIRAFTGVSPHRRCQTVYALDVPFRQKEADRGGKDLGLPTA